MFYMTENCVNISEKLDLSVKIRDLTLTRCYAISGYTEKSLDEKNKIYDSIKKDVEAELLSE